jgi:hypothetical protein
MSAEVVYQVSPYCAQNASFTHIPFCFNSNSFVSQDYMDICCFHSWYKMSWTLFSNESKCSLVISRDLVYSNTRTKYVILIDMLHCMLKTRLCYQRHFIKYLNLHCVIITRVFVLSHFHQKRTWISSSTPRIAEESNPHL